MTEPSTRRYRLPEPIVDEREREEIDALTEKYEKMTRPGALQKAAKKASELVPQKAKDAAKELGDSITQQQLFEEAMRIATDGFKVIQENAAKFTIDDSTVIKRANEINPGLNARNLEELSLARSYELSQIVNKKKVANLALACVEGAACGVPGLPGIPFNLVLSTFLYFRAVQQVAVCYGYDVKNSAEELAYASDVFAAALNPRSDKLAGSAELLAKMMAIGELEATKAAAKKTWAAMVAQGGLPLFVAQLRALARKEAQAALANAGKKGLEQSLFKNVLEQVGKRLALKNVQAAVPVVGGIFGALFDTSIMNTVVSFADICYRKRFLLEKERRIEALVGGAVIEVDASVIDGLDFGRGSDAGNSGEDASPVGGGGRPER